MIAVRTMFAAVSFQNTPLDLIAEKHREIEALGWREYGRADPWLVRYQRDFAEGEQATGCLVGQVPQLPVGGAVVRGAHDQGFAVAVPLHGGLQILTDGLPQQRRAAGAVSVGEPGAGYAYIHFVCNR